MAWEPYSAAAGLEIIRDGKHSYVVDGGAAERCEADYLASAKWRASRQARVANKSEGPCAQERATCFVGVRFDPELIELTLVDVVATINENPRTKDGVRVIRSADGGVSRVPAQYTMETLAESTGAGAAVLANAGWSWGIDVPEPIGFQVVSGVVLRSELYPTLSTIVCLDPAIRGDGIPQLFYHAKTGHFAPKHWDGPKKASIRSCGNAIQVGPRIIEEDNRKYLS